MPKSKNKASSATSSRVLFCSTRSHLGRCISDKIHQGNRCELFLKVHCNWIIPFSKEVLLTEKVKTSNFIDGNDSLSFPIQLKYNNGHASLAHLPVSFLLFPCFLSQLAKACRLFPRFPRQPLPARLSPWEPLWETGGKWGQKEGRSISLHSLHLLRILWQMLHVLCVSFFLLWYY